MEEMSFEQRLKKAKTGFHKKRTAENPKDLMEKKERQLQKVNKGRKKVGMPKERYSKIPVKDKMMSTFQAQEKGRDPRFLAGDASQFNKGLFEASYNFINDMTKDRKKNIKRELNALKKKTRKNKKLSPAELETQEKLTNILAEESNLIKVYSKSNPESKYLKEAKKMNKERAKKGQNPIYYKKRELKEMRYKEQFDKLDKKKGRVDKEIQKAFRKV
ncbi:unnamed protein product [Moneuplotes crassus]|uniref:rRNA biogenesis protein RRP36 n=2 Tax=Euplotes crassus TaxID=5936 RepID=A0AAD1XUA9_EUPCR|nr:unnamed protein product [Moneuplotes crassus]